MASAVRGPRLIEFRSARVSRFRFGGGGDPCRSGQPWYEAGAPRRGHWRPGPARRPRLLTETSRGDAPYAAVISITTTEGTWTQRNPARPGTSSRCVWIAITGRQTRQAPVTVSGLISTQPLWLHGRSSRRLQRLEGSPRRERTRAASSALGISTASARPARTRSSAKSRTSTSTPSRRSCFVR